MKIKTIVNGIPEKFDEAVNAFEAEHSVKFTQTEFIDFQGGLMFRATIFYE